MPAALKRLRVLKELLEAGLITEDEMQARRGAIEASATEEPVAPEAAPVASQAPPTAAKPEFAEADAAPAAATREEASPSDEANASEAATRLRDRARTLAEKTSEKRATHKAEMEDPGRTARSRNIDAIRERASSLRQRR